MQNSGTVPQRRLGRTGDMVSAIGLGGFHVAQSGVSESQSIKIIRTAIDNGITFLDNCWDYNDGASERRMGKALQDGYRQRAFLMTKIDGRDKATAARQINESLERLQTDVIDLMQLHEVIRNEDPEWVFAPDGAIEALVEARDQGKIRYIGFTGHKSPDMHLHMLETAASRGFRFDTVQMPLNLMDAHFNSFEKKFLPVLLRDEIGVLGMKPLGAGVHLQSRAVAPTECLHYALNLPTSVVITGCDSIEILEQALDAARSFRPLDQKEVEALLAKTRSAAQDGHYEPYKTTYDFDGTHQNPEWLGVAV